MGKRVHILISKIDDTWFTKQSIQIKNLLEKQGIDASLRPVNQGDPVYPKLWLPRHSIQKERYTQEFIKNNNIVAGDTIYCHFGDLAKRIIVGFPEMPCKFIVHCHGYDVGKVCYQDFHFYSKFQEKVHKFITPTSYLGGLLACHGVPTNKIECIQYGVDPDFWTPAPERYPINPFRAVSVSRLIAKKRVLEAMHSFLAFSLAMQQTDRTYTGMMAIVGDGPQFEMLRKTANKLNDNSPGVKFVMMGDLKHEDVRRVLHQSHVFVACNARAEDGNTDGSPIAWLESLACNVPVVAPEPLCEINYAYKATDGTVVATAKAIHGAYRDIAQGNDHNEGRRYIMTDANWNTHCNAIVNLLLE